MASIGSFLLKKQESKTTEESTPGMESHRSQKQIGLDSKNVGILQPNVVELYASVNGLFVRLVAAVCVSCSTGLGVAGPKFT